MSKPRLLDLFCGQGGAGMGYHRAGFDVFGVDNQPQPQYPFQCVQADALEYVRKHGREYDVIHASPPCQIYSRTRAIGNGRHHEDMMAPTQEALESSGVPWVIENVVGAPMKGHILILCGTQFGLKVLRHRLFQCSEFVFAPPKCIHPARGSVCVVGRRPMPDQFMCVAGHFSGVNEAKKAMGIDWPTTRDGLSQAIPPAYTEWIGRQLIRTLEHVPVG